MLRKSWDGVGLGWGGVVTFLALAHMVDATQVMGSGGLGGGVGMMTFLALAQKVSCTCLRESKAISKQKD